MGISMTRENLIEKLNGRLVAATAEDERLAKAHRAEEAAALKKFREAIREAIKWDYPTVKKNDGKVGLSYRDVPSCPQRHANAIKSQIRMLEFAAPKSRFRLNPGTDLYRALMWVPPGERDPQTVCD